MTWLIAEDETDIRNLIAIMCQAWGHQPLTFENGQKVWDWLDTVEENGHNPLPELILLDIRMPGKKGNELAQRMRSMPQLQRTPIVLMTAYSLNDRERQDMMTDDGVDHILNKPLPDFEQLRTILHDIVSEKQKQPAPEKPAEPEPQPTPAAISPAPEKPVKPEPAPDAKQP